MEGLARGKALSSLQEAFLHGGAQCGICTPGMLLSAHALIAKGRVPSEAQVREALAGNLCRCTGYVKIVEAVIAAAKATRKSKAAAPRKPKAASSRAPKAAAPRRKAVAKKKPARRKSGRRA